MRVRSDVLLLVRAAFDRMFGRPATDVRGALLAETTEDLLRFLRADQDLQDGIMCSGYQSVEEFVSCFGGVLEKARFVGLFGSESDLESFPVADGNAAALVIDARHYRRALKAAFYSERSSGIYDWERWDDGSLKLLGFMHERLFGRAFNRHA